MQFLNKRTQKFLEEKMPWDKSVPYRRELEARLVPEVNMQ